MSPVDALERAVEAVLFASETPLTIDEIRAHVGQEADVRAALAALERVYAGRGIELARLGKAEIAQDETFGPLRLRRAG